MTKVLIPRSDSVSAKIIEPSDFEKLGSDDIVPNYKKSGFTLSAGSGLAVNVAAGVIRLNGLYLESTATESISSLTASDVNYLYVKLDRDSGSEAESWSFDKNLTGVTPTDAFFIGTATTDGSGVTAVDQSLVIKIAIPKFGHLYFGDGSDGDVTLSSNTDISELKRYNNLTINSGVTLSSSITTESTLMIQVKDTLTINGTISMNNKGGIGGAGGPAPAGAGPNVTSGIDGEVGSEGGTGSKDSSPQTLLGTGGSGAGGRVENPGAGLVTAGRKSCADNIRIEAPFYISTRMPMLYGAGGSGGTSGRSGRGGYYNGGNSGVASGGDGGIGGDGGNGGGGIIIMAKTIVFNSGAVITANGQQGNVGGIGGNGGCSAGGKTNGGGGDGGGAGGGGEGGYIVILYEQFTNSGTITVTGGANNIGGTEGFGDYPAGGCGGNNGPDGESAAGYSSAAGSTGTTKLVQLTI